MFSYQHKFKKHFSVFIMLLLTIIISGCSASPSVSSDSSKKIKVICTGFAQYDWTKNIASGLSDVEVSLLADNGIDIHSFQPSAEDIVKISSSDMIIYTGGQSDKDIIDIIDSLGDNALVPLSMISLLGDTLICNDAEHNHGNLDEYDEHIWLSLKNAKILCRGICKELSALDPSNADKYIENTEKYISQLNQLDREYTTTVDSARRRELVFADRYPFKYLSRDYGLDVFAAFSGCSTESDASFETILSLAAKIDELRLTSVITTDDSNSAIANTVCENTKTANIKVLSLESLQSITNDEITAGITYLGAMSDNLEILREALN